MFIDAHHAHGMTQAVPFAGCFTSRRSAPCVFLGIADDTQSSYLKGAARAPDALRAAYDGRCYNSTTESGVDVAEHVLDGGTLGPGDSWGTSAREYERRVTDVLRNGQTPFIVGGDHAVTIAVLRAFEVLNRSIHVIQIDAHPDLYPEFEGNPNSHACTGARALEMEHVASVTQLGIRTMNREQRAQQKRFADRLVVHEARALTGALPVLTHIPHQAPVYLTVDMDGFDPAFAPGVSHPVPGGLSSRQVLDLIQGGHWRLVGMDVVEVNPSRDVHQRTAVLAARLLHEGMGYALSPDALNGPNPEAPVRS